MSRQHYGVIGQGHQLGAYAFQQLLLATTGEVGAPYPEVEQGIPGEDHPMPGQRYAARGVARGMEHCESKLADLQDVAIVEQVVGLGNGIR